MCDLGFIFQYSLQFWDNYVSCKLSSHQTQQPMFLTAGLPVKPTHVSTQPVFIKFRNYSEGFSLKNKMSSETIHSTLFPCMTQL